MFSCCRSLQPLGHVSHDRLSTIWTGLKREAIAERLAEGDYSMGCQSCELEIAGEGWDGSYAASHDAWVKPANVDADGVAWPTRFDFNLSNSCNLQCVQCDGDSSSSIRIHREHRAALPTVYADEFFDDLRAFIPHLRAASFAGGEPFLGEENFRVWDLIAELAPSLPCTVITNATQWSGRIEQLIEQIPFSFIVSLDGISKATYESIRVGARHEEVMANIDRLQAYVERRGTQLSINHCLMPSNYHEFGELLLWAEAKGLRVDVAVVRQPAHSAIGELPIADIRRIHEHLRVSEAEVLPQLRINRQTWLTEVARISSWATDEEGVSGERSGRMVLWFPTSGAGPVDTSADRLRLAEFADDGEVHEVVVGVDDLILRHSGGFIDSERIIGQGYHLMAKLLTDHFGVMRDYEVVHTSDDRFEARSVWGTTEAVICGRPLRDGTGRATEAAMLFAFRSVPPAGESR